VLNDGKTFGNGWTRFIAERNQEAHLGCAYSIQFLRDRGEKIGTFAADQELHRCTSAGVNGEDCDKNCLAVALNSRPPGLCRGVQESRADKYAGDQGEDQHGLPVSRGNVLGAHNRMHPDERETEIRTDAAHKQPHNTPNERNAIVRKNLHLFHDFPQAIDALKG
jgi:hypothetical protein